MYRFVIKCVSGILKKWALFSYNNMHTEIGLILLHIQKQTLFFNDFEDPRCCSVVLHLFTLGRCSNNCKWISSVAFSLHFLKALTEGVSQTLYISFYRTSSGQSSNNSSKRRIIDWAKSWKRYNRKHQHNETNPEGNECQCKRCITRAMNNPEKALNSVSQIDKISRIVFPAAFALLNGFYWFSYLKHSQRIDLNFESA